VDSSQCQLLVLLLTLLLDQDLLLPHVPLSTKWHKTLGFTQDVEVHGVYVTHFSMMLFSQLTNVLPLVLVLVLLVRVVVQGCDLHLLMAMSTAAMSNLSQHWVVLAAKHTSIS
jgi:hypothetical protein